MINDDIKWFYDIIDADRKNKNSYKNKSEIKNLLYLFVDNCPSKKGPENCKKFVDYGMKSNADYGKYKQRIFKSINLLEKNYNSIDSQKNMENYKDYIVNAYNKKKTPTILFVKGNVGEIDALFTKIRNAFAHKNYYKKGNYYIIWNESTKKDKLSCFIMLKYIHLQSIFNELNTK